MRRRIVKDNTTQIALDKAWRRYGQPLLPSMIGMMGVGIYLVKLLGLPAFPYDLLAVLLGIAIPFAIFQVFTSFWFSRSLELVFCPDELHKESVKRGIVLAPIAKFLVNKKGVKLNASDCEKAKQMEETAGERQTSIQEEAVV